MCDEQTKTKLIANQAKREEREIDQPGGAGVGRRVGTGQRDLGASRPIVCGTRIRAGVSGERVCAAVSVAATRGRAAVGGRAGFSSRARGAGATGAAAVSFHRHSWGLVPATGKMP